MIMLSKISIVQHFGLSRSLLFSARRKILTRTTSRTFSVKATLKINDDKINEFDKNGFIKIDNLISRDLAIALRDRYDDLFNGKFETGIYPDEWHWRRGISKENSFREIVNGWKSDNLVSSVVLSKYIGDMVSLLMKWDNGARIGQDDILWKPPNGKEVGYHQDSAYISSQFKPYENNSATVWIALDDVDETTGGVEYCPGSHKWIDAKSSSVIDSSFHGLDDYRKPLYEASFRANKDQSDVQIVKYEHVHAGSAIIHHQDVWHGSGPNLSNVKCRRALGIHLINAEVMWTTDKKVDYIYGRYKRPDDVYPDPHFFPRCDK